MKNMDLLGANTMFKVTYEYGAPNGSIKQASRWSKAKTDAEARTEVIAILQKDPKVKYQDWWFKIKKVIPISQD